ncbi:MAG: hypothetical protein GF411_14570 [Candidatus Lokiarchaeota archaeon]|nr:hypothetical protein [Candidatus Lokiarchaeota archaeon]
MSESQNTPKSTAKLMAERKAQCAQAIFATYGPLLSSGEIDYDMCLKIASAFGGGINLTGNVCGALTGGLMALGLKFGGSPLEHDMSEVSTKLLEDFKTTHGSILCRELVDGVLDREKAMEQSAQKDAVMQCMKYVEDVAKLISEYVD